MAQICLPLSSSLECGQQDLKRRQLSFFSPPCPCFGSPPFNKKKPGKGKQKKSFSGSRVPKEVITSTWTLDKKGCKCITSSSSFSESSLILNAKPASLYYIQVGWLGKETTAVCPSLHPNEDCGSCFGWVWPHRKNGLEGGGGGEQGYSPPLRICFGKSKCEGRTKYSNEI